MQPLVERLVAGQAATFERIERLEQARANESHQTVVDTQPHPQTSPSTESAKAVAAGVGEMGQRLEVPVPAREVGNACGGVPGIPPFPVHPQGSAPVPNQGTVDLNGVSYQWRVGPMGLQLQPVNAEPSQVTGSGLQRVLSSRAASPFREVVGREYMPRTPSPARKRVSPYGARSDRGRGAVRGYQDSPTRSEALTPATAPGRLGRNLAPDAGGNAAPSRVLHASAAGPAEVRMAVPQDQPRIGTGLNPTRMIEDGPPGLEARDSGANRRSATPVTPTAPTRPKIVYPFSPGGTEIRPPTGPPPRTPSPGGQAVPERSSLPNLSVMPGLPNAARDVPNPGRDRYAPGDRVWWSVPVLPEPDADAAVKAADWLIQVKVIMSDLSAGSGEWWQMLVDEAKAAYDRWAAAPAIQRTSIKAIPSPRLSDERFTRLESRAFSMIHSSLPSSIKEELLAARALTCLDAIFVILKTFQPGGLAERSRLLDALSQPGIGSNPKEVVDKLRAWTRHLVRAESMGVSVPDASILMRGLDSLSSGQLAKHGQVNFRMSVVRNRLSLDHAPTEVHVKEYAEALQSEFTMLAISGTDDKATRAPKVAMMGETEDSSSKGAGKGAGKKGSVDKPTGRKACTSWFTAKGCAYGSKCKFLHSPAVTKGSGRCFGCSGEGHSKHNCPYQEAGGAKACSVEAGSASGSKAKAKAKTTARKVTDNPGSGGAESAADSGTAGTGVANSAQAQGSGPADQAQAQLLREATDALKALALRAMARARKTWAVPPEEGEAVSYVEPDVSAGLEVKVQPLPGLEKGLLDSGASVCLRQASPEELVGCKRKQVTLAIGSTWMFVSCVGTILSETPCSPIVSLQQLVQLGYKLRWTEKGVELRDRKNRRIPVDTSSGCPEIPMAKALLMIEEIEQHLRRAEDARRGVVELKAQGVDPSPDELLRMMRDEMFVGGDGLVLSRMWLGKTFPAVPAGVLDCAVATPSVSGDDAPWNRRQRRTMLTLKHGILLNLSVGSVKGCFQEAADKAGLALLDVDLNEDVNLNASFGYLMGLALQGKIKVFLAGPRFQTWNAVAAKPSGSPGVRTREGDERWGKANLNDREKTRVDQDNLLFVRILALALAAGASNRELEMGVMGFLLEQPRDPSEYVSGVCLNQLPSLYSTPEWKLVKDRLGLEVFTINQGPLGCSMVRPTQLGSNLGVSWLQIATSGVKPHAEGEPLAPTSGRAPGLISAIATAVVEFSKRPEARVQALLSDADRMRQHILNGHLPYWKRCRACVEGRSRDRPHKRSAVADINVLSVDLAGPFRQGRDERLSKVRYALVAVLVIADLVKLQASSSRQAGEVSSEKAVDDEEPVDDGAGVGPVLEDLLDEPVNSSEVDDDASDALDWGEWSRPEDEFSEPAVDEATVDKPIDDEGIHLLKELPTRELVFTELLQSKRHTHTCFGRS